ncbi:MAG: hypothetical protein ACFE95_08510 [Candidatus Hodarchaeota archaeon]
MKVAGETPIDEDKIEIFSPRKTSDWEGNLRHLVRLASLLGLGLLVVKALPIFFINLSDDLINVFTDIISPVLIVSLTLVFLVGLILVHFQIQWINENRNKSTNFGGSIGLFGLFLTLVPTILSIISDSVSFIQSVFLPLLLGLGIILTFVGVFAEVTRIDEPLVYWFRVFKLLIVRLFLFIIALSFMAVGFIEWNNMLDLPLIIFVGGYVFGIAVWHGHAYFRKISTALSIIVVLLGFYILVPFLISGEMISWPITPPLLISGLLIVIGIGVNAILWRNEIYSFLVSVKNAIIQTVRATYLAILAFFQYTWDHRIDILRAFLTVVGPLLIIVPFFLPPLVSPWDHIDLGIRIGLIFGGLLVLYAAWFYQVNHFIKRSLLAIKGAIVKIAHAFYNFLVETKNAIVQAIRATIRFIRDTLRSAYLASVAFLHYVLDHRIDILRALATVIGPLVILGALILPIPSTNIGLLVRGAIILIGCGFLYAAWFYQVNHFVKRSLLAIKDAIVKIVHAFYNFLVEAKNAFAHAIRTTIRFFRDTLRSAYLASIAFLHYTWDHRIDISRAIMTIIGSILTLGYLLMLIFGYEVPLFKDLEVLVILIGLIFLYVAWFYKVNLFAKQAAIAIRNGFIVAKNAVVQAIKATIKFTQETLQAIWEHRIAIMRSLATLICPLIMLSAVFLPIPWPEFELFTRLMIFLLGIGLLYAAWFHQVNHFAKQSVIAIHNTISVIKDVIVQAVHATIQIVDKTLHSIWDHRINILRAVTTLTGFLMIIIAFLIQVPWPDLERFMRLLMILLGVSLLYVAWSRQINYFVKQSAVAIREAVIKAIEAFFAFIAKTLEQLRKIATGIIDLIIPISLFVIAIFVGSYGFLLLITVTIDQNHIIDKFLINTIPLLETFARILQGANYEIWGESLLGAFLTLDPVFQIVLGCGIAAVGIVILLFAIWKRESMRLQSLLKMLELQKEVEN